MSESRTRLVLRVLKKGRTEFQEFWTGDDRLPYQGWQGKLAKHQPLVYIALVASMAANVAWALFSLEKMFEDVSTKVFFRLSAWLFAGTAALLVAWFVFAVVVGSVVWFRRNLRAARADDPDNDETKKKGA